MSQKSSDLYQIGLLVVILILLGANALLFLRLNRTQAELLTTVRALQASSGAAAQAPRLAAIEPGTPVPAFELTTVDGAPVSLADYQGEPVLLVFSAVTCPACEQAYPTFRRWAEDHPERQLLLVSRGSEEENRELAEGFSFPVAHWRDEVAQAYEIPGTPFGVLVDADGVVRGSGVVSTAGGLERVAGP